MFPFITRKPFWVNLLVVVLLGFSLIFLALQMLGWFTRHGEYLKVPDVKGKSTAEAIRLLEGKGFDVVIQDSVYLDTIARGTVIKQIPDPNSTVKVNRAVYLKVNRYVPPLIVMPALEGKGMRYAIDILERSHFRLGDTLFRPDFMKGSVIEQQYNGVRITPGTRLQWGSPITLIIGSGLEDEFIPIPDLIGKTYGEAKLQLDTLGITLVPVPDASVSDTVNAFIYKQNPSRYNEEKQFNYIKPGMVMDIWLSREMIFPADSTDLPVKTKVNENDKSRRTKRTD